MQAIPLFLGIVAFLQHALGLDSFWARYQPHLPRYGTIQSRASFGKQPPRSQILRKPSMAEMRFKDRSQGEATSKPSSAWPFIKLGKASPLQRKSRLRQGENKKKSPRRFQKAARINTPRRGSKADESGLVRVIASVAERREILANNARDALANFRPLQVFAGFIIGVFFLGSQIFAEGSSVVLGDSSDKVMQRTIEFGEILRSLQSSYVDDVDIDVLFGKGANSMLATLDPYSNVASSEDFDEKMNRQFGGLGIGVARDSNDDVIVAKAYEGYAYDAGIRGGDRILKINEQDLDKSMSLKELTKLLRGEPGTSLTLTIQRDGAPEPMLTIPVSRKIVNVPSVPFVAFENKQKVGFIKIATFTERTGKETEGAISALQETHDDMQALVLDMRDNPGGFLDAALQVSELIVPEGADIVSVAGPGIGKKKDVYRSGEPPILRPATRLVILVNEQTASAAEIVTGAVQDIDRGVVVGARTFGKGLVQSVSPLPFGDALTITAGKYYTPSGRCIQKVSYNGGRLANSRNEQTVIDETIKEEREFRTKAGRLVKASGGIAPDVVVNARKIGELEYLLFDNGIFSEFTSDWLKRHPAPANDLVATIRKHKRDIYSEFVTYAKDKLKPATSIMKPGEQQVGPSQRKLDDLEKILSSSGSSHSSSKRQVLALRQTLMNEMMDEFRTTQDDLEQDVANAILARLISPTEQVQAFLDRDAQVEEAKRIAADPTLYERLLKPGSSTKQSTAELFPKSTSFSAVDENL